MLNYNFILPVIISLILFLFISCNQSDEQRKFENEAFSLPENFTETSENGSIVDDNIDPDDWRIAPFFQGVVQVDPPFPNPLLTNERININIQVTGLDGVSGLRVLAFYSESSYRFLYEDFRSPLPTGFNSISLEAQEIARFDNDREGLYRIIIEDLERNIITYGDIQIE